MNIQKAKEQIKNAMKAYFTKDEFGNYLRHHRMGIKFNRFGGCRNGKAKFIDLTSNPHSRSIVWLR